MACSYGNEYTNCLSTVNNNLNEIYCNQHKCKNNNCNMKKVNGSQFCKNHKCIFCNDYANNSLCNNHSNCIVEGCKNSLTGYNEYCNEHKCMYCNKKRTYNQYCNDHFNIVNNNNFCKKYKCVIPNCSHLRNCTGWVCNQHQKELS